MKRRRFLVGTGSIAIGSTTLIGSGAFSSVEAERSVDVNVADDANAYLALRPSSSGNGEYATEEGGMLQITLGSADSGAGVNKNATTIIRNIFEIHNQGAQSVYVWVEGLPPGLTMFTDDRGDSGDVSLDANDADVPDNTLDELEVPSGSSMAEIGISVHPEFDPAAYDGDITIVAKTQSEL